MQYLTVWLRFPDGAQIIAGEIAYEEAFDDRRLTTHFAYNELYLLHPKAFPLDPIHLPLSNRVYSCDRHPEDIHSAFEDSLPDAWGRQLLAKQYQLKIDRRRLVQLLLHPGSQGIGALSFTKDRRVPPTTLIDDTPLDELLDTAFAFENGDAVSNLQLAKLFGAGTSPGGARPKVLIGSESEHWLVKFPSVRDSWNMVELEAACISLAAQSGIPTVEHQVRHCGERKVLFVRRFDITATGRNHLLSFQSLLGDGYRYTYGDLAHCVRQHSDQVEEDLGNLFRQMLFNILIGNTDDHPKNFTLLHAERGWKLSPAYDLLPNVGSNPEHCLAFLHSSYNLQSRDSIFEMGRSWFQLSPKKTKQHVEAVYDSCKNWRETIFIDWVAPADRKRFELELDDRIAAVVSY